MNKVYPFASGSEYTASFAVTASFATTVKGAAYVVSASKADTVLYPQSGSAAAVNLCLIEYSDYLKLLSGGYKEICNF